jgi:anaerobic selenocysteine-containing dehydrogenase
LQSAAVSCYSRTHHATTFIEDRMPTITACSQDCPDSCSLLVDAAGGRVRVDGNPDHPFTAGFCCAKLKAWPRRLSSPNRITRPLRRDGSGWRAVGWEEALDLCAARLQALRAEPLRILHLDSSGNMGLAMQVPQHFFALLGASRAAGGLCASAGIAACEADFGRAEHNDPRDLLNAAVIVNWGKDIARTSVHLAALVSRVRRKGTRVLTLSPGGDGHEGWSDEFIHVRPGADRYLAAAVCRLLIDRGRVAPAVGEASSNWPQFRRLLQGRSAADWAHPTGVGLPAVERLADIYGSGASVATLIGWGLQRHVYGGENVRCINALAVLSGNLGRRGAGSYYIGPSTRHLDLSWKALPQPEQVARFFKPTLGRDILQADPPVGLIWANGTNPVNQSPDVERVAAAFRAVPFKVVVDAFPNDTVELADLVLPCTLNLEQENLEPSFFHDFINYARPAVLPPAEARTDHWILSEVGRRLDPPIHLPTMGELIAASLPPGIPGGLAQLHGRGFVEVPRRPVAFEGLRFAHPDGRCRFPEVVHPEPLPPPGYPLRLLSLIRAEFTHSQILPEDHPEPRVYLAPESPGWSAFDRERPVFLASPLGRLRVYPEPLPGLHPEVVVYRRGDWRKLGGGINRIVADLKTDLGSGAAYYSQHVRLEN